MGEFCNPVHSCRFLLTRSHWERHKYKVPRSFPDLAPVGVKVISTSGFGITVQTFSLRTPPPSHSLPISATPILSPHTLSYIRLRGCCSSSILYPPPPPPVPPTHSFHRPLLPTLSHDTVSAYYLSLLCILEDAQLHKITLINSVIVLIISFRSRHNVPGHINNTLCSIFAD